jgi:hypothetical protein
MNIDLGKAEVWLTELGIGTCARPACLCVSRKDIVTATSAVNEEAAFTEILSELRTSLNTKKLFWGGRDVDWIYLESF